MGKEIFRGSREKALRLFFEPAKLDGRKARVLKSRVIDNWGHWELCLEGAFGQYRRILTYLAAHRRAFHKALSLLDRRFLVFVLGAYQSFLFNRILEAYLADLQREHRLSFDWCSYSQGRLLFYRRLPEALFERLRAQTLPVPGWDSRIEDPRIAAIAAEVLRSEDMAMEDLKIRQISGLYINGILRPALLLPEEFSAGQVGDDELYRGRKKMTLRFGLPRGGYATLIVKRLQAFGQRNGGAMPAG
jgi:tRNA(Glu) U13 pseudouridine synthase TruD